jgi:hypothetical protein
MELCFIKHRDSFTFTPTKAVLTVLRADGSCAISSSDIQKSLHAHKASADPCDSEVLPQGVIGLERERSLCLRRRQHQHDGGKYHRVR